MARVRDEEAKEAAAKSEKAATEAKAKVEEAEKAEKDGKPAKQRTEDGKFAKARVEGDVPEADAKADKGAAEKPATGQDGQDRRQSEGQHREPPARFLPEARTKWANVPNEVKAEFHRVSQEMEGEIAKGKEASERYERLRQYDDTAKSNGRDLRESLEKVVRIEQHMARDPIGALDTVLREIGPRKQDGTPVSLYEVAQVIVAQGPQAQRTMPIQQAQQESPQVSALAKELNELKSQLATQSVTPTIERFAAAHTDYHSLEPQIAEILNSGVVDKLYGTGLSPEQKLTEAYRMAGGTMSPSRSAPELVPQHSDTEPKARPVDPDGHKSIRGAPNGQDPDDEDPDATDIRTLLRREMRKAS